VAGSQRVGAMTGSTTKQSRVSSRRWIAWLALAMTKGRSVLQPVAGLEDPPHQGEADRKKRKRHAEAEDHADVRDLVKAPAEAGDQIDYGIEQRDRAPARRQHVHGIEAAAEKRQRRHHQHRDHLQLLKSVGPDADDEAEQAER